MVLDRWLVNIEARLDEMDVDEESIIAFLTLWDEADDVERIRLRALSDRRLLREIRAVRALQTSVTTRMVDELGDGLARHGVEVPLGEVGFVESPELEDDPDALLLAEAVQVVSTSTIPQVLAWVGRDRQRAKVALEAEEGTGEALRPSLLRRLSKLADF